MRRKHFLHSDLKGHVYSKEKDIKQEKVIQDDKSVIIVEDDDKTVPKKLKQRKPSVKVASDFDLKMAAYLKKARKAKKMSMEKLAEQVGITFQQIQKYEAGQNRLTLGRLVAICDVLELDICKAIKDVEGEKL